MCNKLFIRVDKQKDNTPIKDCQLLLITYVVEKIEKLHNNLQYSKILALFLKLEHLSHIHILLQRTRNTRMKYKNNHYNPSTFTRTNQIDVNFSWNPTANLVRLKLLLEMVRSKKNQELNRNKQSEDDQGRMETTMMSKSLDMVRIE